MRLQLVVVDYSRDLPGLMKTDNDVPIKRIYAKFVHFPSSTNWYVLEGEPRGKDDFVFYCGIEKPGSRIVLDYVWESELHEYRARSKYDLQRDETFRNFYLDLRDPEWPEVRHQKAIRLRKKEARRWGLRELSKWCGG